MSLLTSKRFLFSVFVGLTGCAVLVSLGTWQLQRLEWKMEIINTIEQKIKAYPIDIPATPDQNLHTYLSVKTEGTLTGPALYVLTAPKDLRAGYRYIRALELQGTQAGRRIMADMGWVSLDTIDMDVFDVSGLQLTGNLNWPDETDDWTPEPDQSGIWFARDVSKMAASLNTEPTLFVARSAKLSSAPTQPLPDFHFLTINTSDITNDHLNYAITWFSLAAIWAAMTCAFGFKHRRKDS